MIGVGWRRENGLGSDGTGFGMCSSLGADGSVLAEFGVFGDSERAEVWLSSLSKFGKFGISVRAGIAVTHSGEPGKSGAAGAKRGIPSVPWIFSGWEIV